ncbi:MAG: hypothetical protein ACKVON_15465 [Beijerinckiaceae bacterium]
MPASLKAFAEREFIGEPMIWAEKPDHKLAFFVSFGIWLFAIPWTAFALFWESMVAGPLFLDLLGYEVSGKPPGTAMQVGLWVMALFGVPFIVIGFGMLLAPFWIWRKGKSTLFVLTNKRLTVLQGNRTVSVVSIKFNEIVSTSRKEGPDGRGTLILHQGHSRDSDGDRVEKKTELGVINDVRRVEQLVNDLRAKAA